MSGACAAAPSSAVLIAFRVLQGAFGALMISQGFGMLKESFDEDEMGTVFGAFGPVMDSQRSLRRSSLARWWRRIC